MNGLRPKEHENAAQVYELLYREYVGEYEYVLRAKAAFLKVGQARQFAEFLERIRSLALSSADRKPRVSEPLFENHGSNR